MACEVGISESLSSQIFGFLLSFYVWWPIFISLGQPLEQWFSKSLPGGIINFGEWIPFHYQFLSLGQHNLEFRSVSTCRRLILYSYEHNKMSNHARRRSLHWDVNYKLWILVDEMRGRSMIISSGKSEVWLTRSRSCQLNESDNL